MSNITEALERQDKIQRRIKVEKLKEENQGFIPLIDAISLGANIVHRPGNAWIGVGPKKIVIIEGEVVGTVN